MAEKRKLIAEIDKCFKKVDEGFEIFDEIMSKVSEANSDNQREKFQDDLKKEIKKLQRLRDQIKGWQNSSEIKDKERLNQYRRLIEQRMETFKDIERENKTKPHSKQGLSAEDKLDPKEKEKSEAIDWVNNQIRHIQDEIDRTESKIEAMNVAEAGGKGKKGKKEELRKNDKEKLEELRKHLERVKFHLRNLEIVMRLFTNEQLDIKEVLNKLKKRTESYQEPVEMYIEALDPENDEDPEALDPEDIYEELDLSSHVQQLGCIMGSMDEAEGGVQIEVKTSPPCGSPTSLGASKEEDNGSLKQRHQSGGDPLRSCTAAAAVAISKTPLTTPLKLISQASAENTSSLSSPPPPTPPTPAVPVLPYAVAAGKHHTTMAKTISLTGHASQNPSSANATSPPLTAPVVLTSTSPKSPTAAGQNCSLEGISFPSQPISTTTAASTVLKLPSPGRSVSVVEKDKPESPLHPLSLSTPSTATDNSSIMTFPSPVPTPVGQVSMMRHSEPANTTASVGYGRFSSTSSTTTTTTTPVMSNHSNASASNVSYPPSSPNQQAAAMVDESEVRSESVSISSAALRQALHATTTTTNTSNSNSNNNDSSGQQHKTKSTTIPPWLGASPLGMAPANKLLQDWAVQLESALNRVPSQMDSERPRNYLPKMPCQTPSYYPQTPPQGADMLDYYLRLSPETLFFAFYYMEGSRAQLLAAKALKKLSWRFHTKYLMWFQRHEEPKVITDDYEQGTYVYFNFEKWQQQKKEQFVFEYKYLEDNPLDGVS